MVRLVFVPGSDVAQYVAKRFLVAPRRLVACAGVTNIPQSWRSSPVKAACARLVLAAPLPTGRIDLFKIPLPFIRATGGRGCQDEGAVEFPVSVCTHLDLARSVDFLFGDMQGQYTVTQAGLDIPGIQLAA